MSSKQKSNTSSPSQTSSKPSAAERTIGLFTGKSVSEERAEAVRIAASEDIKEEVKEAKPLKPNEERKRWEARSTVKLKDFQMGFRITEIEQGYLLERLCIRPGSEQPFAYGIFIFHKDLLISLRDAINEHLQDGTEGTPEKHT